MDWVLLLGGGLLLYLGAEWFVGGAAALALLLRIPQILIGLTVVAYGTSAPEIIVGVEAARSGHGEVALGNVIGSNIANVGLILALAVLIRPAKVDAALCRRELPVLVVSAALVPAVFIDGNLSCWESVALLLLALAYTAWMVHAARSALSVAAMRAVTTEGVVETAGAPTQKGVGRAAVTAAFGLLALLAGGNLFIQGAVSMAHRLGMSERLVGLTVVAVGTSLPELVTSVLAARRGHSDLAVGNVVGSNIFNVLLCLGAAGLSGTIHAPFGNLHLDIGGLLVMTAILGTLIRSERTISRSEGAVALVAYAFFMVFTAWRI